MTTVPITRPSQSAWDGFDDDERGLFQTLVALLAQEEDWRARKPLFLKIVEKLKAGFEKNRRASGSALPFMALLPAHVGAILEGLEETEIGSVEQAAFYLLSVHPEHQVAADAWLQADRAHQKDFLQFVNKNPFYAALLHTNDQYQGDLPDGF